jgi:hypothetical protein
LARQDANITQPVADLSGCRADPLVITHAEISVL